jgi:hypothetical protein
MAESGATPGGVAGRGTLDDFVKAVAENPDIDWKKYLFWALGNSDLVSRLEIANWMLDHGADPAQIDPRGKINALHVLLTQREHDYPGEGKLLQRLLDGGADINLKASKWNVPIQAMLDNRNLSDDLCAPLYDVIFSHPGIDWDVIVRQAFGEPASLKKSVELAAKRRPELHRRMCEYLEKGPSPRPVFD